MQRLVMCTCTRIHTYEQRHSKKNTTSCNRVCWNVHLSKFQDSVSHNTFHIYYVYEKLRNIALKWRLTESVSVSKFSLCSFLEHQLSNQYIHQIRSLEFLFQHLQQSALWVQHTSKLVMCQVHPYPAFLIEPHKKICEHQI